MFFRRGRKDKLAVAEPAADAPSQPVEQSVTSSSPARPGALPGSALRRSTDPATLGFKTTAELSSPGGLFGQDQALAALALGATIRASDHNVVIVGAVGSAERNAILSELRALNGDRGSPSDWVYVADFDNGDRPRELQLPAGSGRLLASMMDDVIDEIRSGIVATLGSDSYQTRWRAIDAEAQARQRAGLDAIARTADTRSIALLRTPMGYAVAPAHEGSVVHQETFSSMPPTMQADVRAHISTLESDLSELMENAPQVDRQRRVRLSNLNREVVLGIARAALADPREIFARDLAVMDYLASVEADILANANRFLPTIDISDILGAEQLTLIEDGRFDRYRVNVFVSRSPNGPGIPVEYDPATGWAGLFGQVSQGVAGTPAHMQLVAGALHHANGGSLLLDARELTASPEAWPALLACLKAGVIRSATSGNSRLSGTRVPPVPLDVKIILLSDAGHLRVLAADPRFAELFKVKVEFADSFARTLENERDLARRFADIASQEGLNPLEAAAVAELIDLSARRTGNRDRLSLTVGDFIPLMWEADVCRAHAAREVTSREDIVQASLILRKRGRQADATAPDVATQPAGVIQCLEADPVESLAGAGANSRIRRISARLHPGLHRSGSIDISGAMSGRESYVARQIASYLAAEFCRAGKMALVATLESLPPLEDVTSGRSATCAGLMAILSAICELPLPPTIAVTGTFDQFGNLQDGSGINEAIEEFFDATVDSPAGQERGVVIPAAALPCLMLRQDILDAVAAGAFKVWSADTVAGCFTVLSGQQAGNRGDDGRFIEGDAYRLVEAKLQAFDERASERRSSTRAETP